MPSLLAPHVLVVDDDASFRCLLRAILEERGMQVTEEPDASHVVEAVRAGHPDVVLLDWRMSGGGGLVACRRLRATPAVAGVPIAMVTGLSDSRDRAAARQAGADAFVCKRDAVDVLVDTVLGLVADARAAADRSVG